ncbi:hypothetical protein J6590_057633 [Homalodisca vitripennis]|nr:hypothetical protein J6590_057633 [Homalodisca vitripennis]
MNHSVQRKGKFRSVLNLLRQRLGHAYSEECPRAGSDLHCSQSSRTRVLNALSSRDIAISLCLLF